NKFDATPCDVAKSYLAKAGVPYVVNPEKWSDVSPGFVSVDVGKTRLFPPSADQLQDIGRRKDLIAAFQ
ncbi:hypothetical protein, partial [Stenotrophomonas maltophilia]